MQTENDLTADKIAALEEYIIFKEKELEEIKEMFDKHAQSLVCFVFFFSIFSLGFFLSYSSNIFYVSNLGSGARESPVDTPRL